MEGTMDWREAIENDAQDDTMAPPEEYQQLAAEMAHAEGLHLAAAVLGARGGRVVGRGTGAAKRRGDSAHYRAMRVKRPAPQVYASPEWCTPRRGFRVREGLRGWHVETDGGERLVLAYSAECPRAIQLDRPVSDHPAAVLWAEAIWRRAHNEDTAGVRLLRRGTPS
jgi:hypothetical protein